MCVNNLSKVVTWQRNGRELNSRPLESQANALTIAPPRYTAAPLFGDLLSVFQALAILSAGAYQRRAMKGFKPQKLPKLDLTTDAEYVANLANVGMWL